MILYVVQVHRNAEQILNLLKLLMHRRCFFLISVDPASALNTSLIADFMASEKCVDYLIRRSTPITWAGASQVYAWIDLLKFCRTLDIDWSHCLNLSGECIPLVPSSRVLDYLEESSKGNVLAHLSYYGPPIHETTYYLARLGDGVALDGGYTEISYRERVQAIMQNSLEQIVREADPLLDWTRRGSFHVTDLLLEKKLVFRRLFPFEADERKVFLRRHSLNGGRAWFAFARSAVDVMLDDPYFYEVINHLQNYLCADELFLQTYFRGAKAFSSGEVRAKNLHYRVGEPVSVTDNMIDDLFDSVGNNCFFARKVNYASCPRIVARAHEICLGSRG